MGDPLTVFAAADAGLCKSGTTTLEAALADVPMVIAYRLNPVSFAIAIRMLQVPHVGLVNLIAGREVSPELLQGAVTPDRKSTRLNSSHGYISYAVFCLKKKKNKTSYTGV